VPVAEVAENVGAKEVVVLVLVVVVVVASILAAMLVVTVVPVVVAVVVGSAITFDTHPGAPTLGTFLITPSAVYLPGPFLLLQPRLQISPPKKQLPPFVVSGLVAVHNLPHPILLLTRPLKVPPPRQQSSKVFDSHTPQIPLVTSMLNSFLLLRRLSRIQSQYGEVSNPKIPQILHLTSL
jgi:hypothetical protein